MRNHVVAILVGVGTLALIPAGTLAQMRPGEGMSRGMGLATGPVMERPQQAAQPREPSREVPAAPETPRMPQMTGAAMQHPTAAAPFHKEWTFLVLVGVAIAGAGFFAYRITRSRVGRRYAPTSFVAVINRAFRLEGLTPEGFAQLEGGIERGAIPERNRIFLDEEAARELRAPGISIQCVGFCSLKGFSGLHRVYQVLWESRE